MENYKRKDKHIVVVDIDGTISKIGERIKYLQQQPKDWESFYKDSFDDEPILEIIVVIEKLHNSWTDIVFCTGRTEICRDKTMKWFEKYFRKALISESLLLMRKDNDHRHDTEVKPELLKEAGITSENVLFILEDRNSMVKKWRDLGFICLQVAEGDF